MIPAASAVRTPIPAAGSLLMRGILADAGPGIRTPRHQSDDRDLYGVELRAGADVRAYGRA